MDEEKLKDLSVEELQKKERSLKGLIVLFILLIIGLSYPLGRNYFNGEEIDMSLLIIAICTLSGPATFYPQLKEVKKELKLRRK